MTTQPVYQSGDVVCLICKAVIKNNHEIKGISHGYCLACGQVELAKVDAWIAEFTQAKASFAAQISEVIR